MVSLHFREEQLIAVSSPIYELQGVFERLGVRRAVCV